MSALPLDARAYARQAALKAKSNEIEEAAFLYTQAYVLALEAGEPAAQMYQAWLVQHGREAVVVSANSV